MQTDPKKQTKTTRVVGVIGVIGVVAVFSLGLLMFNPMRGRSSDSTATDVSGPSPTSILVRATAIPDPAQYQRLIDSAVVQTDDLPSGWELSVNQFSSDMPNNVGRYIAFLDPRLDGGRAGVSEILAVYVDRDSAKAALPDWIDRYYPVDGVDGWGHPPDFTIKTGAEDFWLRCLPMKLDDRPIEFCGMLARYDNVVMVILSNISPPDIPGNKSADVKQLVEIADRKLVAALEKYGQK